MDLLKRDTDNPIFSGTGKRLKEREIQVGDEVILKTEDYDIVVKITDITDGKYKGKFTTTTSSTPIPGIGEVEFNCENILFVRNLN